MAHSIICHFSGFCSLSILIPPYRLSKYILNCDNLLVLLAILPRLPRLFIFLLSASWLFKTQLITKLCTPYSVCIPTSCARYDLWGNIWLIGQFLASCPRFLEPSTCYAPVPTHLCYGSRQRDMSFIGKALMTKLAFRHWLLV
jgi:hypothetical protein